MKLSELPVFFLDLQTTGSRPGESDILEMAWGDVRSPQIESVLLQPSTGFVPRRIQLITGIGDSEMVHAVDLPTAFEKLHQFLKALTEGPGTTSGMKAVAVIHFAQFEKPFLLQAYELLQQKLPFEILCTHQIAKRLMPNLPTRGTKGLAGYFGYNSGELKRSSCHVEATRFIWQGLSEALRAQSVDSLEALQVWLSDTPATKRKKYEYPMEKEKRLSLPDQPGVYRMVSRWGEVLYVGKATSLHSRVNSYFRGQKNRDPRKLEMLTQAWDLQVTPCSSPLEAALLETDEIKRLNPRYNISLKSGGRAMVFFNRDFTSMSFKQNDQHCVGPFSNGLVLDSVSKLSESLKTGVFNPLMFFEPIDPVLLELGFRQFCERHGLQAADFVSVRSILAVGLGWLRSAKFAGPAVDETELESGPDAEDILALTAEDIADKFERHFVRAARAYQRARHLTRLLNADIVFQLFSQSESHIVRVRGGQLQSSAAQSVAAQSPASSESRAVAESAESPSLEDHKILLPWAGLSIDSYDRMSILSSELEKIRTQDGTVQVKNYSKNCHS